MDYLYFGPQLKHYVTPHAIDASDFDKEALAQVAREKITELKAKLKEVSEHHDQRLEILKVIKDPYVQFHKKLWEYEYQQDKYYIEIWIKHWRSLIKKPVVSKNRISKDDIEKAKHYPLDQLYQGNLRHHVGRYVGLCPFHQEKTPSFTIFPDNNYFCFGCNANGDPINFLMESRDISFIQAVRELT